ncbi:DEAD/DEAH box helicase family protein [Paraburkholderia sp. Tr-20389]|uniref:DEAD/DEAH box helicase n=1 Tax=Paraburkholderia sp. Tr-20389 TaxID=2703903 RepID=UPI00197E147F|nr:DEAD/DEAH box helicase family protein [Paraburkholderia sp. Tr-20389]MBN3758548.1 DEAD/DEAH box helicase family protein [Paraburkholderia sp. Tr-20389]
MNFLVTAPQSAGVEPEEFQKSIIRGMTKTLLRETKAPCLLRAPTGSGKTYMLARVLADVSAQENAVWFWFVPFVNLVAQTLDALVSNTSDLTPQLLVHGRNQDPAGGEVLISTAQAVAKAQWRNSGYNADGDDDTRTLAELRARAIVKGLKIGLVVDEAHIALDKATEFGKFAQWLNADYLIMATATPRDQRILDFLAGAGKSEFESFTVSRDEVVDARLNKRFIEAIVYDLRSSVQTVADLKRTVLRQAWKRNQRLKSILASAEIPITPLLLVQVANGDTTVEEAERDLIRICNVPAHAIGKHSSDEPDPVLMAAIANDSTKEVLIFKQSAGTGFDAPRAFVLASTKAVNDTDFAMQFIGRVMRVARAIRTKYVTSDQIPEDLNTAYVYLANAEAQRGFESAVAATSQIKSALEGQTEKLVTRQTMSGAVVYSNRSTPQAPIAYDFSLPASPQSAPPSTGVKPAAPDQSQETFRFDEPQDLLDEMQQVQIKPQKNALRAAISSEDDLSAQLSTARIRPYLINRELRDVPLALKRERRPDLVDMSAISQTVAAKLDVSQKLLDDAVRVALNRVKVSELHTELTTKKTRNEQVRIVTDRNALAKHAITCLRALPQVEDADCRIIIDVLAQRVTASIRDALDDAEDTPDVTTIQRSARDAAHWIVIRQFDRLEEGLHEAIAAQALTENAEPLPDAMLFPVDIPLTSSSKNIYGVLPPTNDELSLVEQVLLLEDRALLSEKTYFFEDQPFRTGKFDGVSSLNSEERAFARALDDADFVEWWHRNPDRKPYSVRLVRGEHKNFFHPDFVVCLQHYPGDKPILRLIETKENVKDAARKAKHVPDYYGKVLFLTKDHKRLRWVREDGSLGSDVDLEDLHEVREWLRSTRPVVA